jgi:hypothetical protein
MRCWEEDNVFVCKPLEDMPASGCAPGPFLTKSHSGAAQTGTARDRKRPRRTRRCAGESTLFALDRRSPTLLMDVPESSLIINACASSETCYPHTDSKDEVISAEDPE